MNRPGPKNSGPNPRSFPLLVGGTLGLCQVCPLLDEILATYLQCPGSNCLDHNVKCTGTTITFHSPWGTLCAKSRSK